MMKIFKSAMTNRCTQMRYFWILAEYCSKYDTCIPLHYSKNGTNIMRRISISFPPLVFI